MSHHNDQPADLERTTPRELDSGEPLRYPRTASSAFKDADYASAFEDSREQMPSGWGPNGVGWWVLGTILFGYFVFLCVRGGALQ